MKRIILGLLLLTGFYGYSQSIEILPGNTSSGNIVSNSGTNPGLTMFKSGTSNPDKMIISHSSPYTDWGLQYRDVGDQFNFIGDGNTALSINLNSYNVGVGTSAPGARFDVANSSTGSGNASMRLLHSSSTGYNRLNFENLGRSNIWMLSANSGSAVADSRWNIWHTTTGNILTVSGDGNVGIGDSNPDSKVHINHGGSDTNPHLKINATSTFSRINWTNDANTNKFIAQSYLQSASASSNYLRFEYNGFTKLNIAGDGNITHTDYTKLGSAAPAIKMKKLSGTTAASATTSATHGLDFDKILAVDVFIYDGASLKYPPQDASGSSRSYRMYIGTSTIVLTDISANLQGETYQMLITYEE